MSRSKKVDDEEESAMRSALDFDKSEVSDEARVATNTNNNDEDDEEQTTEDDTFQSALASGVAKRAALGKATPKRGAATMPSREEIAAWRIDRLKLTDFKSYGGVQLIGPFRDFQAIIGPNGAGELLLLLSTTHKFFFFFLFFFSHLAVFFFFFFFFLAFAP
jgi:hypothetical protein